MWEPPPADDGSADFLLSAETRNANPQPNTDRHRRTNDESHHARLLLEIEVAVPAVVTHDETRGLFLN
jgi:hypothetical protein